MKIQTLSIVVPTKRCINNCVMCCSKMHYNEYINLSDSPYYLNDLKRRLNYAVINNVDTVILTGTGEVLQNISFISTIDRLLKEMKDSIPRIEIQTSGVLLNDHNLEFLRLMGVSTISLSIMDLFNDERNMELVGVKPKLQFKLDELCEKIINFGFNIRLSLNMSKIYDSVSVEKFFEKTHELGAKQITFRKLYSSKDGSKESIWVEENAIDESYLKDIHETIKLKGEAQFRLPFGAFVYTYNEISTVIDDNCMAHQHEVNEVVKYLILREDGKLYSDWEGNCLIF